MQETLHGYNISISVGGRTVHNVCFEDYIELMADSNNELHDKTNNMKEPSHMECDSIQWNPKYCWTA